MTLCQSAEFEFSFKPVDFANVLAGVIAIVDVKTKEKRVDINVELSERSLTIKTDIVGSNRGSSSIFRVTPSSSLKLAALICTCGSHRER